MPTFSELQLHLILLADNLRRRPPGLWPPAWRLACAIVAPLLLLTGGGIFFLQSQWQDLQAAQLREGQLKVALLDQLKQAAGLPEATRYHNVLRASLTAQARNMLPAGDSARVEEQLADINRLGVARRLRFDKFQRNAEVASIHHAALPISMQASGSFADVLGFVGDIARLPHIVTLSNLQVLARPQDDTIVLEATATVYRQPGADKQNKDARP